MLAAVLLAAAFVSPATALQVAHVVAHEQYAAFAHLMNMSYFGHLREREGRQPLIDIQLPGLPPLSQLLKDIQLPALPPLSQFQLPGLPKLDDLHIPGVGSTPPLPVFQLPLISELLEGMPSMMGTDMHNVPCMICGGPLSSRSEKGKKYKKPRTDCGSGMVDALATLAANQTVPVLDKPLYEFTKPGSERESGLPTNAFCELNIQKSCTDAINNEDYMYYAKSITGLELVSSKKYDFWYCKHNGWLDKEIVDIAHSGDFNAMRNKGVELCETQYAKYNWKNMSIGMMEKKYSAGMERGEPTFEEANYIGAWNCAMGDASCDMTYCAYSYCDLGDGQHRLYKDCPGWTRKKGMRP